MSEGEGCVTFLTTQRSKEELATALAVLLEFKECESDSEWFNIPFAAWAKFEQFEEFLEHLVNGAELRDDTKEAITLLNMTQPKEP